MWRLPPAFFFQKQSRSQQSILKAKWSLAGEPFAEGFHCCPKSSCLPALEIFHNHVPEVNLRQSGRESRKYCSLYLAIGHSGFGVGSLPPRFDSLIRLRENEAISCGLLANMGSGESNANKKAVGDELLAVLPKDGVPWYKKTHMLKLHFCVFSLVMFCEYSSSRTPLSRR